MNIKLLELDKTLKNFLTTILLVLAAGVVVSLAYLNLTTDFSPEGTTLRFNGNADETTTAEFEIPENFPKTVSEMLITTHNHIFGFSFLFFITGIIYYFNSIINGFWKSFFLIEPIISILVTFGSIWLMRYIDEDFVYLTIFSSIILYLSFFFMASVSVYEMKFKKITVSN